MSSFAPNTVMNAACSVAKTHEDIQNLVRTNIDIVTIGSITVDPRTGNPEPRWYSTESFAINSFGMPNEGLEYYRKNLPTMISVIHDAQKKANLSVAGFNTDEYTKLAAMADQVGVDFVELNLGCPNVQVDGKQKPIASFDMDYMEEIINAVRLVCTKPILIKLSPYSNPAELNSVASLLGSLEVSGVVTSNTFANTYSEVNGKAVVAMEYGGLSGKVMAPIGLGQVRQFRAALPASVEVIGVGGIESYKDASDYFDAGASAVQVATLIVRDGHSAINKVKN